MYVTVTGKMKKIIKQKKTVITIDSLREVVIAVKESKLEPYAIRFKDYDSALSHLLIKKLESYLENFRNKKVRTQVEYLSILLEDIKNQLPNEK